MAVGAGESVGRGFDTLVGGANSKRKLHHKELKWFAIGGLTAYGITAQIIPPVAEGTKQLIDEVFHVVGVTIDAVLPGNGDSLCIKSFGINCGATDESSASPNPASGETAPPAHLAALKIPPFTVDGVVYQCKWGTVNIHDPYLAPPYDTFYRGVKALNGHDNANPAVVDQATKEALAINPALENIHQAADPNGNFPAPDC